MAKATERRVPLSTGTAYGQTSSVDFVFGIAGINELMSVEGGTVKRIGLNSEATARLRDALNEALGK